MPSRKEFKLQIGSLYIQTGAGTGWRCPDIQGDEFPDYDTSVKEYADGDGGYIQNTRIKPRYIDLSLQADIGYYEIDATMEYLQAFLDGKSDAILTIYKGTKTRIGYGRVVAIKKVVDTRWNDRPYVRITFMMQDPLYVGSDFTQAFLTEMPIMSYPMSYLEHTPVTVGLAVGGNSRTFTVGGHGETGFVLTLTASGAVTNPSIENADGDTISAVASMVNGDILTISTVTRDVYVKLNGVLCEYALDSDFFKLAVGSNTLTVSADSGVDNLVKSITWKERYRG